jgi:alkylated DNA repair dioxygenase AlkB
MQPDLNWQPSLIDGIDEETPSFDVSYAGLRRIQLDDRSWVDYCPGWLAGSDSLFAELVRSGRWKQRSRWMYTKRVDDPRLTAGWSTEAGDPNVPEIFREMAADLSRRYEVGFDRIWANLYRDGADSVAWHGDKTRLVMTSPLVATVSLGARRKFQLRRRGTTTIAHALEPGHGDLVVMGGRCQSEWEHTVPKTKKPVGGRISVTIRHSKPGPGESWLKKPQSTEPGHAW